MKVRPFKRAGLHRLECDCGGYAYSTVAQLETVGMPSCACGARFHPGRIELAGLLGITDAPCVAEYDRARASAEHGQTGPARNPRNTLRKDSWRKPEQIAFERVSRDRAEMARTRRLTALRPAPEALPF